MATKTWRAYVEETLATQTERLQLEKYLGDFKFKSTERLKVKQTVRYEPKASTSVPNKGATNLGNASKSSSMLKNQLLKATVTSTKEGNITMSNSYAAFGDKSEEDIENVYDKSANLLHSSKTGGISSTFTATAG
ncbi:hypothetical protein Tco_1365302 [Tanacetum coccineum]